MNYNPHLLTSLLAISLAVAPINAAINNNSTITDGYDCTDDDRYIGVVDCDAPQNDKPVLTNVEVPPTFPGGEAELMKFIAMNIRYPESAQEKRIQGRVIVSFVVQMDGTIGQTKIMRSVDPDLDKEALRVVKKLPKFIPGKMNGEPVNVWYTLPVSFKLQ